MSDHRFVFDPAAVHVRFEIHPADINLNSLLLLNHVEGRSGLGEWVENTYQALPAERREDNRLVLDVLLKGMRLADAAESFPDYIAQVEAYDSVELRDKVMENYREAYLEQVDVEAHGRFDTQVILSDRQQFLRVARAIYEARYGSNAAFNEPLYSRAHTLLTDPHAMHHLIVAHLQYMWEHYLRSEWENRLPMLQESVDAFQALDYSGMSALEAVRVVTGRDLSSVWPELDSQHELVFMPSAHIGPYVSYYTRGEAAFIIYGARLPEGIHATSSALSRSELLSRINALADDTRLTVLELLTHEEKLFAQEIMTRLDLSQSSASRHLRQLVATGFIREQRHEVAKYYSLNRDRVEDTLKALRQFLLEKHSS